MSRAMDGVASGAPCDKQHLAQHQGPLDAALTLHGLSQLLSILIFLACACGRESKCA